MSTYAFYNPQTQELGRERKHPYRVDGVPATPPDGLVDLEVIREPFPQITDDQKVTSTKSVDLTAKTITFGWLVENKTAQEIRESIPDITPHQFRVMLHRKGKTDDAKAYINNLPVDQRVEAQLWWEYVQYIKRTHPLVIGLATALGLGNNQMNAAFVEASQIT
jgi:hypothetical protein